jgi:hypothetical protein
MYAGRGLVFLEAVVLAKSVEYFGVDCTVWPTLHGARQALGYPTIRQQVLLH